MAKKMFRLEVLNQIKRVGGASVSYFKSHSQRELAMNELIAEGKIEYISRLNNFIRFRPVANKE